MNVLVDLRMLNSEGAGDWATGVWDAKAFGGAIIELRLVRSPAKVQGVAWFETVR